MVLCPTGTSVNPSAPPTAWITWLDAQSWLGSAFGKFSFLTNLFSPYLVTVATFCATEPVQPVYPGDAAVVAAATDPVAFESILTYLKQSSAWWAWHNLCQCNAAGTPACVTGAWNHSATPASNSSPTNEAVAFQGHLTVNTETLWGLDVWSPSNQNVTIFHFDVPTTYTVFDNKSLVTGWNRVYFSTPHLMGIGETIRTGMRGTSSGAALGFGYQAGHTHSWSSPVVLDGYGTANWDFTGYGLSANDVAVDPVFCLLSPAAYTPAAPPVPTTTLPTIPTATCTTVGDLCTLINPMVETLALLKQRLDLIQRRLLPFAWIAGTPATGLTGHGTLTVQDALGCIVTLTTVPGGWGSTAETPRRLIPTAGSLQASDATNYDDWRQIHYEHEIYMFDTSWATRINYNFRPGFVATITVLQPEP